MFKSINTLRSEDFNSLIKTVTLSELQELDRRPDLLAKLLHNSNGDASVLTEDVRNYFDAFPVKSRFELKNKDVVSKFLESYFNDGIKDEAFIKEVSLSFLSKLQDKIINKATEQDTYEANKYDVIDSLKGDNSSAASTRLEIMLNSTYDWMQEVKDSINHHLNKGFRLRGDFKNTAALPGNTELIDLCRYFSSVKVHSPVTLVCKAHEYYEDNPENENKVLRFDSSGDILLEDIANCRFLKKSQVDSLNIGNNLAYVRRVRGRLYQAVFNERICDENLLNMFSRRAKRGNKFEQSGKKEIDEYTAAELLDNYEQDFDIVNTTVIEGNTPLFFRHLLEMIDRDMARSDINTRLCLKSMMKIFSENILYRRLAFEHEVATTVISAFGKQPKDNYFYLGRPAGYEAVVLSQVNSVAEKFSNSFYSIAYFEDSGELGDKFCRTNIGVDEGFSVTCFRAFNSNTLKWAIVNIYEAMSWSMHECEYRILGEPDKEMITRCALISNINKDTFAQLADQTRYLYVGASSKGTKVSKMLEKGNCHVFESITEFWYYINQLSMFVVIQNHARCGRLDDITEKFADRKPCFKVSMPHCRDVVLNFDYQVSSMYISNIYNKDKAQKLGSECLVYNKLLDEDDIFKSKHDINGSGRYTDKLFDLIREGLSVVDVFSFIIEHEAELLEEVDLEPSRFSCNFVTLLCIVYSRSFNEETVKASLTSNANDSASDLCTLKGAMEGKRVAFSPQGARSFESVMSYISDYLPYGCHDTASITSQKDYRVDINRLAMHSIKSEFDYCCRIVSKEGKAPREISALNAAMRCGARFAENIAHDLSTFFPNNVLNNPNKGNLFISSVKKFYEERSSVNKILFSNSDQSRWGPNNRAELFSLLFSRILGRNGTSELFCKIMDKFRRKKAKFPEAFISHIADKGSIRGDNELSKLFNRVSAELKAEIYYKEFDWGMFQGILHDVSSVYHSLISSFTVSTIIKYMEREEFIIVRSQDLITSDDGFTSIVYTHKENKTADFRAISNIETYCKAPCNIIRNTAKSIVGDQVAEFNSIFILRNNVALPTLKWRTALINVGGGSDPLADVSQALNSSNAFLSSGGSILGSYLLQLCNVNLYYKQWGILGDIGNRENVPSEMLGSVDISPLITLLSGAVGNMYDKANRITGVKTDVFSADFLDMNRLGMDDVSSVEFSRTWGDRFDNDITLVTITGLGGTISLKKFRRKQAAVVKKLKSVMSLKDSFIPTLKDSSTELLECLFILSQRYKSKSFLDADVEHSFHYRYADPMISRDRPVLKINRKNCFADAINQKLGKDVISFRELYDVSKELGYGVYKFKHETYNIDSLENFLFNRINNICVVASTISTMIISCGLRVSMKLPMHTPVRIEIDPSMPENALSVKSYFVKARCGAASKKMIESAGISYDDIGVSEGTEDVTPDVITRAIAFYNSLFSYAKTGIVGIYKIKERTNDWAFFAKEIYLNQYSELFAARDENNYRVKGKALSVKTGIFSVSKYVDEAELEMSNRAIAGTVGYKHDLKYDPIRTATGKITSTSFFEHSEKSNIIINLENTYDLRDSTVFALAAFSKSKVIGSISGLIRRIRDNKEMRGNFRFGGKVCNITSGFHVDVYSQLYKGPKEMCLVINEFDGKDWQRTVYVNAPEDTEVDFTFAYIRRTIPKYESLLIGELSKRKYKVGETFMAGEDKVSIKSCEGEFTGMIDVRLGDDTYILSCGDRIFPLKKIRIITDVIELDNKVEFDNTKWQKVFDNSPGLPVQDIITNITPNDSWKTYCEKFGIESSEEMLGIMGRSMLDFKDDIKRIKNVKDRQKSRSMLNRLLTEVKKDKNQREEAFTELLKSVGVSDTYVDPFAEGGSFLDSMIDFAKERLFEAMESEDFMTDTLGLVDNDLGHVDYTDRIIREATGVILELLYKGVSIGSVCDNCKPYIMLLALNKYFDICG